MAYIAYRSSFALAWLGSFIPVIFVIIAVVFAVIRKAGAFSETAQTARKQAPQTPQAARGRPADFRRPQAKLNNTRQAPAQPNAYAKPDPQKSFEWETYDREKHGTCCGGDPWEESFGWNRKKRKSGDDPWD